MDIYQQELYKHIADLPRKFLPDLLGRKFREHGITLSTSRLTEIADKLLNEKVDHFDIESGTSEIRNITIDFTEADSQWIEDRCDEVLNKLPEIIRGVSGDISSYLLGTLKKRWRGEARRQHRDIAAFRKQLQKRWGTGLSMLRMQLVVACEFGDSIAGAATATGEIDSPSTFEILIKLHARACQVTDEILCLLEGGFADGAMARWRTLHEIAIVAFLIQSHGDELAERYEQHEAIETWRAAHQFQRFHERLGQPPLAAEVLAQIDAEHDTLVAKYGSEFASQYGWAAKHIGKQRPTFFDIQQAAGIDHLAPYYRMASHNVHANPKGVFFKLGLYDESNMLLAGPSNTGLTDPGHATSISLGQVSSTLLEFQPALDNIVILQVMLTLSREIGTELFAAQKKLDADHDRFLRTENGSMDA